MLSLETTAGWSEAVMTLTVSGVTEAYTHAGQASAYHTAIDFVAWAEHGDRGWSPLSLSFLFSWAKGANGGAAITLSVTGIASIIWAPSGTWGALMNQSTVTAASIVGSDGAAGTSAPFRSVNDAFWAVTQALQFSGDQGDASGMQSIRPFVPGLAGSAPVVQALGDVDDAARLTDVAADASNPRRLAVYQGHDSRWIEVAAGAFTVEAIAPKIFRLTVQAAGDAL